MSERVALAMIAKDKEHIIERVLDSTEGVFDVYVLQDTGSTDSTIDKFINWCKRNNKEYKTSQKFVGKDYKAVEVNGNTILGDFGQARNDSFALIPSDVKWAFWIDTDDILYNPRGIKQLVQICNKNDLDGVIMPYEYAKLSDGIKAVDQQRERLINLKKKGVWKNRVHENYKFIEPVKLAFIKDLGVDVKVIHERSGEDALETNRRNHLIMQAQLDEEGLDKVDEEFVGHMAFDHWEHKEFEKSLFLYEELIKRILSRQHHPDELFQVYLRVARACYEMGNIDAAIANGLKTITVGSNYPDGYLLLAEIYASQGHWDQALFNVEKVISMPRPNTTAPISDIDYLITPRHIKLQAYIQMNRLQEALKVMEELISIMPSNSQFLQEYNRLGAEMKSQNAIRAIGELSNYFQEHNMGKELGKILDVIPLDLRDNPILRQKIKEIKHDFKRKNTKIRFNGPKSIVFFAGPHFEPWDGRSDIEKGIGGSEGMCIQMARELAKLGNKVFVYNECGESDEKEIDGVVYRNYQKWDADADCDIFVSLRAPQIFGRLIKAKKQFLWLHDTGYGQQKLVDMYAPDKIFVLSDYHQDVIKLNHFITDDSIFHKTRNALNKFAVEYADANAGERNPYQVIYASSYDRGLDNVLNSWAKVKEAVPEAVLKIYYGWNTYDGMMNMRAQQDPRIGQQMAMYKSKIIEQISKLPDVYELGRITQNELYKVTKESGAWYYPTSFTEISCITAMTSQAMGAFPVCTPVAALNETVNPKFGIKVNHDKVADALIYRLKNQNEALRNKMMKWARKEFDVESLAKEWDEAFNNL